MVSIFFNGCSFRCHEEESAPASNTTEYRADESPVSIAKPMYWRDQIFAFSFASTKAPRGTDENELEFTGCGKVCSPVGKFCVLAPAAATQSGDATTNTCWSIAAVTTGSTWGTSVTTGSWITGVEVWTEEARPRTTSCIACICCCRAANWEVRVSTFDVEDEACGAGALVSGSLTVRWRVATGESSVVSLYRGGTDRFLLDLGGILK